MQTFILIEKFLWAGIGIFLILTVINAFLNNSKINRN